MSGEQTKMQLKPEEISKIIRAPFSPVLFVEQETVFLLSIEELYQLVCSVRVYNYSILFVIPSKASGIEIGAAHRTELSIYHDNLGMMEAWCVHPYMATSLHQLMGIIETAIWSQWNIALGREHDFYLYASFILFHKPDFVTTQQLVRQLPCIVSCKYKLSMVRIYLRI